MYVGENVSLEESEKRNCYISLKLFLALKIHIENVISTKLILTIVCGPC